MNLKKTVFIACLLLLSTAPIHAGQTPSDSPQSLYLQAGKEERSGSAAKARDIYESIIDRFPESEFAVKANDRLLALPAAGQKPAAAPAASPSPFNLFGSKPVKPLPADPLLHRGVETARKKAKAESVRKEYIERERARFTTSEGHRYTRMALAEKEANWHKAADQKIVDDFGMTLEKMEKELQQICAEAKVQGECSEEAFYSLSAAP